MKIIINRINKEINELKSFSSLNKSQEKELAILENILQELEANKENKTELIKLEQENSSLISKIKSLETNNKSLFNNIQEINKNNSKGFKVKIYDFIIGIITNLLSFALIKYILKRTVPLYLEKLVSYVIMGVIINNIFGSYLTFVYNILMEIFNSETGKVVLSFFGITTFSDWFKDIYQHFKEFFTNLRRDSSSVNLEKFNKEFDKQLEIDKLKRSNEILVDKLDEINNKLEVQERIKILREELTESRTWSEFGKEIAKDWGIQVYNSIKFIVITSLVTCTGKYLYTSFLKDYFHSFTQQKNLNSLDNQLLDLLSRKNTLEIAVKYLDQAKERGELPADLEITVNNLKSNLSSFDIAIKHLEKEYIHITKDRNLTIENVLDRLDPDKKLSLNEDFTRIVKNSEDYRRLSDIVHELNVERSTLHENLKTTKLVYKDNPSEEMKDSISKIKTNIKEVNSKISEVEHCQDEFIKTGTINQDKITFFEELIKNFKVIFNENDIDTENNELSSSTETIKPTNPIIDPESIPLPPSPIINNSKEISNITTSIDNDQQYLAIESQRDQGYVKIDKYNSLEKVLPKFNEEYIGKYETFNKYVTKVSELEKRGHEIENELNTLDITKDFDRISYLQQENVNNYQKALKLTNKVDTLRKEYIPTSLLTTEKINKGGKVYDILSSQIDSLNPKFDSYIRTGYFGGHVDSYIPYFESTPTEPIIYQYDVVSLYPYIMKTFNMPYRIKSYFKSNILLTNKDLFESALGFYKVRVISPINITNPILPYRSNTGVVLYPVGNWTGIYFSEEIKNAIKSIYVCVNIDKDKNSRGLFFGSLSPSYQFSFNHQINDFYARRQILTT
jgi:uncharacterized protein (UPF0335 family)